MKKIINFAPTGSQTTKENSLAPLYPNEIIEEVHQAYELGITLTHIHARDPKNLTNTYKKAIYNQIIEGIRKYCPDLVICVSLTGRIYSEFEKRSQAIESFPDMGSLTMSSINFPKTTALNGADIILKLIDKMDQFGVIPEIECFDSGMLNYAKYLIKKEILKQPFYINVILGNLFNAQPDLISIASIINDKPKNSLLCLGGIGKHQLKSNIMGLLYADGIRIGLEDNFYYQKKEKCSNIDLLKRIHNIIKELDFNIMKPKQFKDLGYGNKKINSSRI